MTQDALSQRELPRSVAWEGDWDGQLLLLDQTRLPETIEILTLDNVDSVWEAIRALRVRGAPAIGIAAAYGACLGLRDHDVASQPSAACLQSARNSVLEACDFLATSRPTAVNLFWALDQMRQVAQGGETENPPKSIPEFGRRLLNQAKAIHESDRQMCHAIGRLGAGLLKDGSGVLTHCNTGGLATAEYGTALSAIFTAQDQGKRLHVYVDETRPLLQGARLTAWELMQHQVPCTLICDSMAAQVMREGRVQAVLVGADRITARGDAANKIGTYSVAVLAYFHKIPFYVAAPTSTFDLNMKNGHEIPIEQRDPGEITCAFGKPTAPDGVQVYNPAFDVTPAELISAIVTERGVIQPVDTAQIQKVLSLP